MDKEYFAGLDALTYSARVAGFQTIGAGQYQKYNPLTGIRTTVTFTGTGDQKAMHVKRETALQVQSAILDMNVAQQNDFKGFKGVEVYQATRIPLIEHEKIMKACGHQPGQGYDVKKFKSIVNDIDYRKLKVVPGRI